MESSWRQNVVYKGLTVTGIRLLARSLEVSGWWLSDQYDPNIGGYRYYADLGDDRGYVPVAWAFPFPGHPHFPYGHRVDPDV